MKTVEHIQPIWAPESMQWLQFNLSTTIMTFVTFFIVLILMIVGTRKLTAGVPKGLQNFLEWVVDFVKGIIDSSIGLAKGSNYILLGVTLILFIFFGNMLGLPFNFITIVDEPISFLGVDIVSEEMIQESEVYHNEHQVVEIAWWKSPTADVSATLALSLMIIIYTHYLGIKERGTKKYLQGYFKPFKFFLPINLIEEVSKFLTLGMRLYGNIFAGEVLIGVLLGMGALSILPLVVWQGFSVFIGSIQAYVFTILSMVYINQKISDSH